MRRASEYYIKHLKLKAHPEGGYYRESFRSKEVLKKNSLPGRYRGSRVFYTSIYFLLNGRDVSKFHRLKSDEIWHFYSGSPAVIYILMSGRCRKFILDKDRAQCLVEKNSWFAVELVNKKGYALMGCTVSPGFEFGDFELAEKERLLKAYPKFWKIIGRLT